MAEKPVIAKVFWSGRSQAIRLPKQFRFDTDEVRIRREGKALVIEPPDEWPEGFFERLLEDPIEDFELPEREHRPTAADRARDRRIKKILFGKKPR